jgi:hypothetical protein
MGEASRTLMGFEIYSGNSGPLDYLSIGQSVVCLYVVMSLSRTNIPRTADGITVLGIPIGTETYVQQQLENLTREQTAALDKLQHFGCAESFVLLKSCFNTRPIYTMRGISPHLTTAMAASHDNQMEIALASSIGLASLSPTSVAVKSLPASLGGLGMRGMTTLHRGAWVSSWLKSLQFARELFGPFFERWYRSVTI